MADLDGGVVGALNGDVGGGAKGPWLLDFAVAADGPWHGLLRLDRVPQALTENTVTDGNGHDGCGILYVLHILW